LLSGERLFDPSFQTEELGLSMEESHLIQIIELFGTFPLDLLNAGEYSSKWFSESGMLIS
jgi:serine/threonine-protein kinase SRPK3